MAKRRAEIKGLKEVVDNLNKAVQKMKDVSIQGLIKSAALIQNDMDKSIPKVPVDTRNLQQSFFIVTAEKDMSARSSFKGDNSGELATGHATTKADARMLAASYSNPVVLLGFSANYAAPVHEMGLSKNGNEIEWSRPGSGPKFFELALKRNQKRILKIIENELKSKLR